ncbi:Uncharacterized protein OBRU01_00506 [Operophtera brumata]|uniref:Uncharacterized protein n=1 Tax=Operophtera brumata TaxID=104452 RepID=A0A0L7LV59_OPEBR|nr:Uncharacterized protein OBRU01_00506 [Operophtera brumata]
MSKKGLPAGKKQEEVLLVFEVDPTECPFREFRDTELNIELWGLENEGDKMSVVDMQLSHAQVLLRSSFCRRVLSYCFILERAEGLNVS